MVCLLLHMMRARSVSPERKFVDIHNHTGCIPGFSPDLWSTAVYPEQQEISLQISEIADA